MLLTTFKALADPTRLRLIHLLARGELTVQDLTEILAMGQSRISRHLKILLEAGWLNVKHQGTWSYYRLDTQRPEAAWLWPVLREPLARETEHSQDLVSMARVFEERRRASREFFDRHARQWDSLSERVAPLADYRAPLLARLPACQVLVDVGVGTGSLLGELSEKAQRIICIDQSPAMLAEAEQRIHERGLSGVELRLGDMARLPLEEGQADVALLQMVLHHAPQPRAVFDELYRILAPGGTLLIADLARHDQEWLREALADLWLGFLPEEISAWLEEAGFENTTGECVRGRDATMDVLIIATQKPT